MSKLDVEISPLAFSKIIDWTSSNTEREIGGYLVGHLTKSKVIITEAVFATAESNPTFVSFDNMIQFNIIEELEKKGKNETIVGWFHSHPGLGCFMSGTDVATQKIYQALLPESVAMVNDGNKFAKTRNQSDFQAHFYRVKQDSGYHEINFGVLTDPNELLGILTDYVQSEENIQNIIQSTAQSISTNIQNTLVTKNEFVSSSEIFTNELTNIRTKLEEIKNSAITNETIAQIQLIQSNIVKSQKRIFLTTTILSGATFFLMILLLIFYFVR
ncbi:MAG: Mov34/MPN/PAD-1 family protein [Candidatus Heimdallarchaeota archaeon]|nr:Mov34/MPN/PAD-1 family protein [Candidatus Heimdallarchaeota archaeon]